MGVIEGVMRTPVVPGGLMERQWAPTCGAHAAATEMTPILHADVPL